MLSNENKFFKLKLLCVIFKLKNIGYLTAENGVAMGKVACTEMQIYDVHVLKNAISCNIPSEY